MLASAEIVTRIDSPLTASSQRTQRPNDPLLQHESTCTSSCGERPIRTASANARRADGNGCRLRPGTPPLGAISMGQHELGHDARVVHGRGETPRGF